MGRAIDRLCWRLQKRGILARCTICLYSNFFPVQLFPDYNHLDHYSVMIIDAIIIISHTAYILFFTTVRHSSSCSSRGSLLVGHAAAIPKTSLDVLANMVLVVLSCMLGRGHDE